MSESISNRRRQAQQDLGLVDVKEQRKMERAMQKEEERRYKKELRQMEIEDTASYRAMFVIAKYLDKWFLDPILGFVLPVVGDFITPAFSLPFIYVAAFQVRSLSLTLAVIFNVLRDMLIGMIPFCIGDICDVFHRCYVQNCKLIVGFVEDDEDIIHEVNRKAVWTAILIALFCYLIYVLVGWVVQLTEWIGSLF